jgi:endonuclease G
MLRPVLLSISIALAIASPAAGRRTARTRALPPPTDCSSFYLGGQAPAPASGAAPTGRVFCHTIYAVSYSVPMLNPLWSAEHLTRAAAIGGDATFRTNLSTFQRQPELTRSQQASNAEFAHNEWDLGHLTPANDAPDDRSQRDTFFLTNVVPQEGRLNRVLWAHLEASVHKLAEDEGEVYIVTGPIFGTHPTLMSRRVPVPDFTFKAIYLPSTGTAAGFVARNDPSAMCTIVSVAEIAQRSGIDPFPSLPASAKALRPPLTLPEGFNVQRNGRRLRVPVPDCQ